MSETPMRDPLPIDLPHCAEWRDRMLQAVIIACALIGARQGRIPPSMRMRLLAVTRRSGLLGQPPQIDALRVLDQHFRTLATPVAARRLTARTMNDFVGTPWATTVLDLATAISEDEASPTTSSAAANAVRLALGLARTG